MKVLIRSLLFVGCALFSPLQGMQSEALNRLLNSSQLSLNNEDKLKVNTLESFVGALRGDKIKIVTEQEQKKKELAERVAQEQARSKKEQEERERLEKETQERLERERLQREEQERAERVAQEQADRDRLEKEKQVEQEKAKKEREPIEQEDQRRAQVQADKKAEEEKQKKDLSKWIQQQRKVMQDIKAQANRGKIVQVYLLPSLLVEHHYAMGFYKEKDSSISFLNAFTAGVNTVEGVAQTAADLIGKMFKDSLPKEAEIAWSQKLTTLLEKEVNPFVQRLLLKHSNDTYSVVYLFDITFVLGITFGNLMKPDNTIASQMRNDACFVFPTDKVTTYYYQGKTMQRITGWDSTMKNKIEISSYDAWKPILKKILQEGQLFKAASRAYRLSQEAKALHKEAIEELDKLSSHRIELKTIDQIENVAHVDVVLLNNPDTVFFKKNQPNLDYPRYVLDTFGGSPTDNILNQESLETILALKSDKKDVIAYLNSDKVYHLQVQNKDKTVNVLYLVWSLGMVNNNGIFYYFDCGMGTSNCEQIAFDELKNLINQKPPLPGFLLLSETTINSECVERLKHYAGSDQTDSVINLFKRKMKFLEDKNPPPSPSRRRRGRFG